MVVAAAMAHGLAVFIEDDQLSCVRGDFADRG
jgi:hypothetical protein